ncbi:MAG: NADPH-dependent 7-cyano-7-deazaguanine reductase QueF [Deltaproteobacteria bacterium]|nr:NADPH-dependent 7-cyano-7-deazaguanine reductase QueF [Deltaproteobacteria bacterium]
MKESPLGKNVRPSSKYDPSLLFTVKRHHYKTVFYGYDIWRAYELSWLDPKGKPNVGILEIVYPFDTESMIESKSLKLYLNGLGYTRFESQKDLANTIKKDLEMALAPKWLTLKIIQTKDLKDHTWASQIKGVCIDDIDAEIVHYKRDAKLLRVGDNYTEEILYSNLLKTNCPITLQPDWGSVIIKYRGYKIDHASLLKYIVSYRKYKGFSERCCEQMFVDISTKCRPDYLLVTCRYTRRGGIDINPVRCSEEITPDATTNWRLSRQ